MPKESNINELNHIVKRINLETYFILTANIMFYKNHNKTFLKLKAHSSVDNV